VKSIAIHWQETPAHTKELGQFNGSKSVGFACGLPFGAKGVALARDPCLIT